MIHQIHIEADNILAEKMKIGYLVQDSEGTYVNFIGVTCRRFSSRAQATLWILRFADSYIPQVREWLLNHVKPFPKTLSVDTITRAYREHKARERRAA